MCDIFNYKELTKHSIYCEKDETKQVFVYDNLMIGVDFAPDDSKVLVVMRRKGDETYILNQFKDEEAVWLYTKLIGK